MKKFACVAIAGLAAVAVLDARQAAFRSGVDLVAVDALVLDRHGFPVPALGADRFDVSINGSKRRIVSVDFIGASPPLGAPRRFATSGPWATNEWPAIGAGRTLMLAIDSASFETGAWQRAVSAARGFVARMDPNDRIGLYAYPFGPAIDVTADRSRILSALNSTLGTPPSLRTTFHLTTSEIVDISAETARSASPGTAVRRTRAGVLDPGDDAPTVQRVQDRECPNDPNCSARILMDADNAASRLEARVGQGLAGLQSLLGALAAVPGRKTVILLSGGMPVSDVPGGRPQADDLGHSLGSQLAQANAVIYTLHLDANAASAVSAAQQRIALGTADRVRETMLMGRWLEQFSAASGGALLRAQTDDGESAFEQVLRENAGYYLLGVEPAAADRNGKLRELKVKVRERGATVRHRAWVIVPGKI